MPSYQFIGELQFTQEGKKQVADLGDDMIGLRFVSGVVDRDLYGFNGLEGKTVIVKVEVLDNPLDILIAQRDDVQRRIGNLRRMAVQCGPDSMVREHLNALLMKLGKFNQQISLAYAKL